MNIAEILKYCPEGTKLYSTIYGEVVLRNVYIDKKYPIEAVTCNSTIVVFTKEGHYMKSCPNTECILFPSKDQRDWNKFRIPAKAGDIMMLPKEEKAFIFKKYVERIEGSGVLCADHYCGINQDNDFIVKAKDFYWTNDFIVPASEKAKKELFDRITKEGYKWNNKKLKLEKIVKTKEGSSWSILEEDDMQYIDFKKCDLRIKPTHRPFKDAQECWNEMQKHQPFGWVKGHNKKFYLITELTDEGCYFSANHDYEITFGAIFKWDTFADGTPFGIKV